MADLASILTPLNETLARALLGPNKSIARGAIGRLLLQDEFASEDEIAQVIITDPAQREKLDAAARLFSKRAASGGDALGGESPQPTNGVTRLEQIGVIDRQKARASQSRGNRETTACLAYGVTIGFFVVLLYIIVKKPLDDKNMSTAVVQTLLEVLGTAWVSIISFYFGSSVGSKEKGSLLEEKALSDKN